MAAYTELLDIATQDIGLRLRIKVACIVACDVIRSEPDSTPNHENRVRWARATLANPDTATGYMVLAVLAQNRAASVVQIKNATDAEVQTAVNAAVDLLAG